MSQASPGTPTQADGRPFVPYIAPGTSLPEFSWRALLMGTILGAIFGASSLYLVLKVGLTVSASIPVAVISMTLFKVFRLFGGKDASILENNIAQTAGSAGESIAFGVGVTMPAIMILGFDLELMRVALVSVLGALLGILMMIPLRRALIVAQHGKLKYPEGTACAEVLKAGASEESKAASSDEAKAEAAKMGAQGVSARTIFAGFGLGLAYKTAMSAFRLWKDTPGKVFDAPFKSGSVAAEISPELLGVGYIIGPYVASLMVGGGVLAYLVLIPMIKFFGSGMTGVLAPGTTPIADMGPGEIRGAYVLATGAGAVAAAGISSFRSLPLIVQFSDGLRDARGGGAKASTLRTDLDLDALRVGGPAPLVVAILPRRRCI
jgi:putative OPT family oligopeptide transporter